MIINCIEVACVMVLGHSMVTVNVDVDVVSDCSEMCLVSIESSIDGASVVLCDVVLSIDTAAGVTMAID